MRIYLEDIHDAIGLQATSNDIQVNTSTSDEQQDPKVCYLMNGGY